MAGTDVVKSFFGGVKAADRIEKARKLRAGASVQKAKKGSEFPYLGTKNGDLLFTYGQDNAPVPEGTLWAVNIQAAKTGWAYWANKKKTEAMASIWADAPIEVTTLPAPSPTHTQAGAVISWGPAYAWQLVAINGPIKGVTVAYEGTANYMLDISEQIILISANRMEESEACFPIIKLWNDPYPNADNGNPTSKHKFVLHGWATIEGEVDEIVEDFPKIEGPKKKAAAPKRARRKAA